MSRNCLAATPSAVTIDVTDDPAVVREMALAGCTGVFVGFESLTDENLAEARKKTPRSADYARRVRMLHDYGIQVNGSFVLGFDHDRPDVFARTAAWVEQNRLECATFHILTPYPGTPLFRQMEAEGRLLHRDWSRYDVYTPNLKYEHLTADEVAELHQACFRQYYFRWNYLRDNWRFLLPRLHGLASFFGSTGETSRQKTGQRITLSPAAGQLKVLNPDEVPPSQPLVQLDAGLGNRKSA